MCSLVLEVQLLHKESALVIIYTRREEGKINESLDEDLCFTSLFKRPTNHLKSSFEMYARELRYS